jgi:hypothetical protein
VKFEIQFEYGNIQWSAFFGNTLETKWKQQKNATLHTQQNYFVYLFINQKIYINSFTILFIYTNGNTILYYYCNQTTQGSR